MKNLFLLIENSIFVINFNGDTYVIIFFLFKNCIVGNYLMKLRDCGDRKLYYMLTIDFQFKTILIFFMFYGS